MRVSWATTYGAPPPGEGGSDDGDGVVSSEEEHPAGTGASITQQSRQTLYSRPLAPPAKTKRRTATVVEAGYAKLAQRKDRNRIPN